MKTLHLCNCSQLHGTGYLEGKLGMYGKAAKREREQDNSCCSRSQGLMEDSKYIGRGEPFPQRLGTCHRTCSVAQQEASVSQETAGPGRTVGFTLV